MQATETELPDLILIEAQAHTDERGFFTETFRANVWAGKGVAVNFVQDNHSRSSLGTLRGMHFQTEPGQAKLVRCARGRIYDVAVDLRRGSPTYGLWQGFELSDDNFRQLFIPVGFAHGFYVLSDVADVVYKCSSYYNGETERGIAFDDPTVGIEWPKTGNLTVSERDRQAPTLAEIAHELPFNYASLTNNPGS